LCNEIEIENNEIEYKDIITDQNNAVDQKVSLYTIFPQKIWIIVIMSQLKRVN